MPMLSWNCLRVSERREHPSHSLPLQRMTVPSPPFESHREENKLVPLPGSFAVLIGSRKEITWSHNPVMHPKANQR